MCVIYAPNNEMTSWSLFRQWSVWFCGCITFWCAVQTRWEWMPMSRERYCVTGKMKVTT